MKIILDAMGGDNAPLEIVKGAAAAIREHPDIEILLVGNKEIIDGVFCSEKLSDERITVMNAAEIITMEDSPRAVVAKKKDSSMAIGLRALADGEGAAFVSAGNTGALMTGGTILVRTVEGIRRGAIAAVLPMERPTLLIDSGSNVNATAENLQEFAILGTAYMEKMFGVKSPRVGLLNNGAEAHKGTPVMIEAHELLSETKEINFVGNIEGKLLPMGECDIIVTDGFTGNVVLKTIEGLSKFLLGKLKGIYKKNLMTMLSAAMIKGDINTLKASFDSSEYGGAPLLGLKKPVFKAHGSANAREIKNAVVKAREYLGSRVSEHIEKRMAALKKNDEDGK